MIKLLPTTDAQTISFIPRSYVVASNISLVVVEDGTRKTHISGNFITMSVAIDILTAENTYSIEVKQGSTLLYRDKIYCTSQTSNTVPHTLNSNKYNEFVGTDSSTQKYILV
jgi:hypothetical protein